MSKNIPLINYVNAGYPGLYLVTAEEARAEAQLAHVATLANRSLFAWDCVSGLLDVTGGNVTDATDPVAALEEIQQTVPDQSLVILRDFHLFFVGGVPEALLLRALKDTLAHAKAHGKTLVVLACRRLMPPEIERELAVIEFDLPGKDELRQVLDGIVESAGLETLNGRADAILDAATGMTTGEAENAFALSVVQHRAILPHIVAREKAHAVAKNGLLEIVEPAETIEAIGGLDVLKGWLGQRRHAFSDAAREFGLPMPKGVLIIGLPGTGKSLTAKATARILGRPLLKLDAGRIYGGIVGQSEENLRTVIQTAEAIAPCVLWIDELEKAFAGSKSSGQTDGGTASRVFGSFLSWMQERTSPVFVVATANDVSQLPPEFLRKGRFDELFFVDLPDPAERQAIWDIVIAKHGRQPGALEVASLVERSDTFTGAEIEQAFIDALYAAFDAGDQVGAAHVLEALDAAVPLAKTMGDRLKALRQWAKGRTRPASAPTTTEPSTLRRIA